MVPSPSFFSQHPKQPRTNTLNCRQRFGPSVFLLYLVTNCHPSMTSVGELVEEREHSFQLSYRSDGIWRIHQFHLSYIRAHPAKSLNNLLNTNSNVLLSTALPKRRSVDGNLVFSDDTCQQILFQRTS